MKRCLTLTACVALTALLATACSNNNPAENPPPTPGVEAEPSYGPGVDANPPPDPADAGLAPSDEPVDTLRKPPPESELEIDLAPPANPSGKNAAGNPEATDVETADEPPAPSLFRSLGRALGRGVSEAVVGGDGDGNEADDAAPVDDAAQP